MKEFSVQEILEFSRSIEMESYTYYTHVEQIAVESELKELASALAAEEMKHYNRMNQFLEENKLTKEELDEQVRVAKSDHAMLIETREIPEHPTSLAILERAYDREVHTGNMYRTLLAYTNLSADLVATFEDLVDQEEGHAKRIDSLIRKIGG